MPNLLAAWRRFRSDKGSRADVQRFELQLEDHLFALHRALRNGSWHHGGYQEFVVHDPKRRVIHKASVSDRLVHHAIVRVIEPLFERGFVFDAWSCRKGKGTHGAVNRFRNLAWRLSRNNTRTIWVLQLDIQRFFQSVDHDMLTTLIERRVHCPKTRALLAETIHSYGMGLPLGNLTSQLLANVYLDPLDQFIKHSLKPAMYLRYCDDLLLASSDRNELIRAVPAIRQFLVDQLHLTLHPKKLTLRRYHSGIDFLGYVCFPHYVVIRTQTKHRMIRRMNVKNAPSYLGILKHCRSHQIQRKLLPLRRRIWSNGQRSLTHSKLAEA